MQYACSVRMSKVIVPEKSHFHASGQSRGVLVGPNTFGNRTKNNLNLRKTRRMFCPAQTVVAEKLQALVDLGMQNSRMKDYYDLWCLARQFSFEGHTLAAAVRATFECRATTLPQTVPIGLSEEFATDEQKNKQWRAFLERTQLPERELSLVQVVDDLRSFLMLAVLAAEQGEDFQRSWTGGGWRGKLGGGE